MDPWAVRAAINIMLREFELPQEVRAWAAAAIFRQARHQVDNKRTLLMGAHIAMASYARFGHASSDGFVMLMALEQAGVLYNHVDETIALLSAIRRSCTDSKRVGESTPVEKMRLVVDEILDAVKSVAIYAESPEDLLRAEVIAEALQLVRQDGSRMDFPTAWKIVCLSRQFDLMPHLSALLRKHGQPFLNLIFHLMEEKRMDKALLQQLTTSYPELHQLGSREGIEIVRQWHDSDRRVPIQEYARAAQAQPSP